MVLQLMNVFVYFQNPVQSFCVRDNSDQESDSVDCCKDNSASANSLCFVDTDKTMSRCLKVRTSIEKSKVCNGTSICQSPLLCLHPDLKSPAKLLQVKRRDDKDFLFVGNAAEVYYYTQVKTSNKEYFLNCLRNTDSK